MKIQNQIKRTLSTLPFIEYIKQLLGGKGVAQRTDLARQVCTQFDFHDAKPNREKITASFIETYAITRCLYY